MGRISCFDLARIGIGQILGRRIFAKSVGVTSLTRTSVHCAERIVAIRSSKGIVVFEGAGNAGIGLVELGEDGADALRVGPGRLFWRAGQMRRRATGFLLRGLESCRTGRADVHACFVRLRNYSTAGEARNSSSLRKALPRWLRRFFCARGNSAKVLP